jgi:hypothetical protein
MPHDVVNVQAFTLLLEEARMNAVRIAAHGDEPRGAFRQPAVVTKCENDTAARLETRRDVAT